MPKRGTTVHLHIKHIYTALTYDNRCHKWMPLYYFLTFFRTVANHQSKSKKDQWPSYDLEEELLSGYTTTQLTLEGDRNWCTHYKYKPVSQNNTYNMKPVDHRTIITQTGSHGDINLWWFISHIFIINNEIIN